jgi:DNA repair protein RadA/Sms
MFSCSTCGAQYPKWTGRCSSCGAWGTIAEEAVGAFPTTPTKGKKASSPKPAPLLSLSETNSANTKRIPSGITEVDRVLGGGIVSGAVTLLAGEPGIGKSTLVAQLAGGMAPTGKTVYYASGEESEGQVHLRCTRLGISLEGISFSNTVDIGSILATAEKLKPSLLIVDSIQTMYVAEAEAFPGTPTAVRAATALLVSFAKTSGTPVLIIGQVTKEGSVAGPKTLEHLVDTVLTLEGDPDNPYRTLRVAKHRFGSTEEVGLFEMTEKGLVAVENPSARFLAERLPSPGSVVCAVMDGNRPFLLEVQALVEKSYFPNPVRRTSGYDLGRLQMLLAIISKRAGVRLHDQDVYVNIVGGVRVGENAADLAVAAAVISAAKNSTVPDTAVYFGEVGLGGEIRSVPFTERRSKEAERHGFTSVISPKSMKHIRELFS